MPTKPGTHKPKAPATARHGDQEAKEGHRLYGYKWQRASKAFLAAHPLCVACEDRGFLTASAETDHIVPHRGDPVLFWDRSNWQPLCKPCHSRKTVTEDGGFGNARGRVGSISGGSRA